MLRAREALFRLPLVIESGEIGDANEELQRPDSLPLQVEQIMHSHWRDYLLLKASICTICVRAEDNTR